MNELPDYIARLNPVQREAVLHQGAPLLILAGAGSGKTRVITTKIAYFIDVLGYDPRSTLAVTFTNKAAREMRDRVAQMVPGSNEAMIRTFHSFGAWLLRRNAAFFGMKSTFTIYDDDDMVSVLLTLYPSLKKKQLKKVAHIISRAKDYCLGPDDDLSSLTYNSEINTMYEAYEKRLREIGNADFGDLILLCVRLLKENPEVAARIASRFKLILVDEYQDSNVAQFEFLKRLVTPESQLCVVGDDDQSIYRFRGAEVQNIVSFPDVFKNTKVVRLEQNYRSTNRILELASSVVKNNTNRLGKTLWTERESDVKPIIVFLDDYREEAEFCTKLLTERGWENTAILYRTNAQSRAFETEFAKNGIPYHIVGSARFYDREEVKDALALLRFILNPKDEVSFRRIVNKPSRGIGKKSIEKIVAASGKTKGDLLDACGEAGLSGKAGKNLDEAHAVFSKLKRELSSAKISDLLMHGLDELGLYEHFLEIDRENFTDRVGNLEELVSSASQFPNGEEGLAEFLEMVELDRLQQEAGQDPEGVTLITMHNTKGLEFARVIITGMEEGIFPRGFDQDEEDLEEERRLFYVSVTRAEDELYLLSCRRRFLHGKTSPMQPSRFLTEVPEGVCEEKGIGGTVPSQSSGFSPGDRVYHDEYGSGTVIKKWYNGAEELIIVAFDSGEQGTFFPKYSYGLEKIADD
ncbi:MAG: ATP-dependent helicase [Spirochaetia bacterium]